MNLRMLPACACALAFLLAAASTAVGQASGTIQSSWNKAPVETQQPASKPTESARPAAAWPSTSSKSVTPAPQSGTVGAAAQSASVWDKGRAGASRPWPYVASGSPASSYHRANRQILDSLDVLYCLSAGYLESLRHRNEGDAAAPAPPAPQGKKDFAYDGGTRAAAPSSDRRAELEALHRELLGLLDRCLGNR